MGLAAVRLRGPAVGRVPVFVCNPGAGLIHPGALSHHVVDAKPHLLVRTDAAADVVSELVVVVAGCGRAEESAQVVTVLTGGVVAFSHRVNQITLAINFLTFQTD